MTRRIEETILFTMENKAGARFQWKHQNLNKKKNCQQNSKKFGEFCTLKWNFIVPDDDTIEFKPHEMVVFFQQ